MFGRLHQFSINIIINQPQSRADTPSPDASNQSKKMRVRELTGNYVRKQRKQQKTVAGSTVEAEYYALYSATCECIWLSRLCNELTPLLKTPLIYQDNQGCMSLAKN
jgi:hypothetical protein